MNRTPYDDTTGWAAIVGYLEYELREAQRQLQILDAVVRDLRRDLATDHRQVAS